MKRFSLNGNKRNIRMGEEGEYKSIVFTGINTGKYYVLSIIIQMKVLRVE